MNLEHKKVTYMGTRNVTKQQRERERNEGKCKKIVKINDTEIIKK
jgi:hypothetical protein